MRADILARIITIVAGVAVMNWGHRAYSSWKSDKKPQSARQKGYDEGREEAESHASSFSDHMESAGDSELPFRALLAYTLAREQFGHLKPHILDRLNCRLNPDHDPELAIMLGQLESDTRDVGVTDAIAVCETELGADTAKRARDVIARWLHDIGPYPLAVPVFMSPTPNIPFLEETLLGNHKNAFFRKLKA